jgi:hypothetical protein
MPTGLSREKYRFLQYHLTQFFTEHLLDAARAFDGDLSELLVLAVIGQVYIRGDEIGKDKAPTRACWDSGFPFELVHDSSF